MANTSPKRKRISMIVAGVLLITMISLPFILQNKRIRTDFCVAEKGQAVRTVEASGIYGLGESITVQKNDETYLASKKLLQGAYVEEGETLMRSESGKTLTAPQSGYVTAYGEGNPAFVTVSAQKGGEMVLFAPASEKSFLSAEQKVLFGGKACGVTAAVGDAVTASGNLSGLSVLFTFDETYQKDFVIGDTISFRIVVEESEKDALVIPVQAILYDKVGIPYCYTVDKNNKAVETTLSLGVVGDEYAEVLSGLVQDQKVVLVIPEDLSEGVTVLPHYIES